MLKQNLDSNELLLRCAKKDTEALKQLYRQYSKALYEIAHQRLKQKKTTELILEKTFIDIWNKANMFDPKKENSIKWMSKIARINATRNST